MELLLRISSAEEHTGVNRTPSTLADSTVLAHIMTLLNERYDYGLDLCLLSIDEGISGYRDASLDVRPSSFSPRCSGSSCLAGTDGQAKRIAVRPASQDPLVPRAVRRLDDGQGRERDRQEGKLCVSISIWMLGLSDTRSRHILWRFPSASS